MREQPKGTEIRLSPFRKVICELMHHGSRTPSLVHAMQMDVSSLAATRRQLDSPPSWLAVFLRAYGLVGQAHPPLRQAYLSWPWERLYQHPQTICTVPVERQWQGEQVLLFEKIVGAEYETAWAA